MNLTDPQSEPIKPATLQFHIQGLKPGALLSVEDTASLLGHTRDWIYRRIYQGMLKTQMISGRHVITGQDLAAYIDSQVPYGPVVLGCDGDVAQEGEQR